MKNFKELGNRYFIHRKKRAALVICSMVMASIFIYTVATLLVNYYDKGKTKQLGYANYHTVIYNVSDEKIDKIGKHAAVANMDLGNVEPISFDNYYGAEEFQLIQVESEQQSTFGYNLVEGSFPKNASEIMLSDYAAQLFGDDVKVGSQIQSQVVDEETEELVAGPVYTVTGIFTRDGEDRHDRIIGGITILDENTAKNCYVRFHDQFSWVEDNKNLLNDVDIPIINIIKTNDVNYELGFYYMQWDSQNMILVVLIAGLCMLLVYLCMVMVRSLFSTSMIDKMHDFSILKSMGATSKQLKKVFFRECYLEGIVAFVIGCALSHFIVNVVLIQMLDLYTIPFKFSIIALVLSAVFVWLTIALAVLEPFGLLKKISIVEGVGQNYSVKNPKLKKRKGKIFRLFGIEGEYAYKNIRRNNRSFWNSVTSFTISILLISVLMTVMSSLSTTMSVWMGMDAEADVMYDIVSNFMVTEQSAEVCDYVEDTFEKLDYVEDAIPYVTYFYVESAIDSFQVLSEAQDKLTEDLATLRSAKAIEVKVYNKTQLEMLNQFMEDDVDAVAALENGGAIVVNYTQVYDYEEEEWNTLQVFDKKVGDSIDMLDMFVVKEAKEEGKEDEYSNILVDASKNAAYMKPVEVKGTATRHLETSQMLIPTVIISYDYMVKEFGKDFVMEYCNGFYINIDDKNFDDTEFSNVVYEDAKMADWYFTDPARMVNQEAKSIKIILIGIVGFCLLFGVINILNNMVNEQLVRKREISLLRAIGMSKKKLYKMLMLEKMLIGIVAWVIGSGMAIVLCFMYMMPMLYADDMTFSVSWEIYGITLLVILALMFLLSLIMISGLGKANLTDNIRSND